jgi:hypothetical protein
MIAGKTNKSITYLNLDLVPFGAGAKHFVDFYLGERKVALFGFVLK